MAYQTILTALADPTRRDILESLRGSKRTVAEIAKFQPVSRPAVSQHLKVLNKAGLVNVEALGTRRYYTIKHDGLKELRDYIDGFWSDVLFAYAAQVEKQTGEIDDRANFQDD
jgi:DNA-binding transcriptional ArsR family regulator